MGRTGTLFASEQDGVRPDITCIAKGLGAGYQPIGAMLCSGEIYAAIKGGSGFFQHGHSYIGHPVATAAGLACYPMAGTIDGGRATTSFWRRPSSSKMRRSTRLRTNCRSPSRRCSEAAQAGVIPARARCASRMSSAVVSQIRVPHSGSVLSARRK